MIVAVVLAAGAARRFGAQKLLAPVAGKPLVRWTVERVLRSGVDRTLVVLGREADAVRAALAGLPVDFVANSRFAEGMSTSLRAGVAAIHPGAAAALVALGDQPVAPEVVDRLLTAHRASPLPIVAPVFRGARGNPVLFASSLFQELLRVEGDRGARDVIARDPGRVLPISFPFDPPPDLDTPEDLPALAGYLARGVQRPSRPTTDPWSQEIVMSMDLQGKTAIVTGSSKGIGYAIAQSLARAGANVVVCARNEEEVQRAAGELDGTGAGRVIGVACDMRSYEDVQRLVGRAAEELGGLDILVNNAGVGSFQPVDEMSVDKWHQIIETNLNGVFYACHEAIPHLRRRGGGWIINIGSLAGKNAIPGGGAYNASKFGLVGFSEAMMLDVRQHGIRVNYIMPGSVATHFNQHSPSEADAWKIQPEDIADLVMALLAMPERTLPSRIEVRPSRPPKK